MESQLKLGFKYLRGEGVIKDNAEAAKWFRKAAEQGNAEAQDTLGWCYQKGLGVREDFEEAANLFLSAAQKGDVHAPGHMAGLGWEMHRKYSEGEGVSKSPKEATKWLLYTAEAARDGTYLCPI